MADSASADAVQRSTEVYSGRLVRGHEQTALHQRVATIGTIQKFLDWFDAVHSGAQPDAGAPSPVTVSHDGHFVLTVAEDGRASLTFTPTAAFQTGHAGTGHEGHTVVPRSSGGSTAHNGLPRQ